jgi:hypothetical protein
MHRMIRKPLLLTLTAAALLLAACPQDGGSDLALLSVEFAKALPCDTLILRFSEPVTARDNKVFEVKVGTAARALANASTVAVLTVTPEDSTLRLVLARQIRASESVELEYQGGISSASGDFESPADPVPVSPAGGGGGGSSGGGGGSSGGGGGSSGGGGGSSGGGGGSSGGGGGSGGDTSQNPDAPGQGPSISWDVSGASPGGIASGDTVTITARVNNGVSGGSLSLGLQKSTDNSAWNSASVSDFGGDTAAADSFTLKPWQDHIGLYVRVQASYNYTSGSVSGTYTAQIADRVANLAGTSCYVDLLPGGNNDGTEISITPEDAASGLQYGAITVSPAGSAAYSGGVISVTGLTPDQDYTVSAAPYIVIDGRSLYMKDQGTIAYHVTPHRGLPSSSMTGIKVSQGAPQGKDGVTYPSTYSITITGGSSPGTYALPRAQSAEFAAWWEANHGGSSVFDTTGCFTFTFNTGKVTKINLENSPSQVALSGRGIKVSGFTGLEEVVMSGLDSGGGSGTLTVTGTPVFKIPISAAKTYKGTIEIGHEVEYRNENPDPWGGIASGSTLRFMWGSIVYLNAGDYSAIPKKPFIAPQWKGDLGQTFMWETMTVSNGSSVELKEDKSVRVDGKITAIKPYTLTGNWTVTGGSMFTIAIGSGQVFNVTGYRIAGSHGALPIANSNIKHSSGTIRQLNRYDGSRRDVTASSERIYDWSGSSTSGGWVF